jgi:pimeloyl-ACP methyl ester carboxylesterase
MPFVDTSVLRIAYEDHQPQADKVLVLLHGWPDSPRTWNQVLPGLLAAGYRVIVPALRGFAPTTFLDAATPRTGQLAALGRDLVEFVQALKLERPVLVGHDWGARAVANAYGLQPDIASHLVMLSVGYGTNNSSQPLGMEQVRRYWYHWYMACERGQRDVERNRRAFTQTMWDTWAPSGWYTAEEFAQTAQAFDNPDWLPVTLHSYQHRWGHAVGDPAYADDDLLLQSPPMIDVPTMLIHGAVDGVTLQASTEQTAQYCRDRYVRHVLPGVGHFPQREAPALVTRCLLEFLEL